MEGARCRVPGAAEDCPSGQACGNDLRCSERAAACVAAGARCAVGEALCLGETAKERVERCSGEVDPVCGAWVVEDCEAAGLECGARSGAAACECPAYAGASFQADPLLGSLAGAVPFPTGDPGGAAPCRFKRLGDALIAAETAAGATGGAALVEARGEAGAPVVFGDVATGEEFPLRVAAKVTLKGAAAPAGPTIVRAEGASTAPLVRLQGAMSGIRIESVPTAPAEGEPLAATGAGISASCGAVDAAPAIEDVSVEGGGTLAVGIDVAGGACGASISGVEVSHVDGPALSVVSDPGVAVTVKKSSFEESAVGIRATGGKLVLGSADVVEDGVEVSGNSGEGIVLTGGPSRTLDVAILGARIPGGEGALGTRIEENGGTGIVLDVVKSDSRLTVRGCSVFANGRDSARAYGPGTTSRRTAGGVLISQGSLVGFVFEANRLSANTADQLGFETSGAWSIAPLVPGCGPSSNLFACVVEGQTAVAIEGTGSVNASHAVWPGIPWGGYVSGAVSVAAYCTGAEDVMLTPPAPASCPAP